MSETFDTEPLQDRLQTLQELTEFTENCETKLQELFDSLEWDKEWDESISKEAMETCPYDPNHRVSRRSMEKHKMKCLLNQMGYSQDEQVEMYDPSGCYERASIPCVIMDKKSQQQVLRQARAKAPLLRLEGQYSQGDYSKDATDVPQNHKRAICDLTAADRLALYDHVIQETESQQKAKKDATNNEDLYVDLVAKLNKDDGQNGPKSHLEVLAEMRDYKRRRQSYRAKNVHITKKSYTEVIREVIDVHSGELAKLWEEEQQEVEEATASKHSSHRRHSKDRRSASVESVESRQSHQSLVSAQDGHSHSSRHKRKRSRERSRDEDDDGRGRRDSNSPEERRHHKKKKKKKKKKKE
ncbi:U11/U12 small nuclear ribonucleoprotein 48 kDa protein [Alosa pseudoharengus]|uniref:U11/U12 small nuclear ribonucleoprotein 48 kDa protein n=1 Tax=Alosa pseudoharengus TaxID=34774 RepID=UPI003F88BCCE